MTDLKAKQAVLAVAALALSGCHQEPDTDRVQEIFAACMDSAGDNGLVTRLMSPVDECHRYAIDVATREANQ